MRKVCNIDATEVYAKSGVFYTLRRHTTSRDYRNQTSKWAAVAFTEPQLALLNEYGYTLRTHPKHSPTVEVFVNEQNMPPEVWTMLKLIF